MIDPGKRWISCDPARGPSGLTFWEGENIEHVLTIKKRGNKGKYYCGSGIVDSMLEAWNGCLAWAAGSSVIIEKGAGNRPNVIDAHGFMRGYIQHECDTIGATLRVVNVSTWRRCCVEAYGVSWPTGREAKKALSVRLAKEKFGIECSDDESDSIFVGVAAIRMGLV